MRSAIGLGSVTVVLAVQVSCSYYTPPVCPNGVLPFDGQTGVGANPAIVMDVGQALPDDLPQLDGAVWLRTASGRVEVDIEVRPARGLIELIPRKALKAGETYYVAGVDWGGLNGQERHYWGDPDFGNDFVETRFTVDSAPEMLGTHSTGDGMHVVMAFSEPVDLAEIEGRVWTLQDDPVPVVGYHEGAETLIVVVAPDDGEFFIEPGLRARSGEVVSVPEVVRFGSVHDPSSTLPRFLGQTWCQIEGGTTLPSTISSSSSSSR